jgi:hypothetical protein
MLLVSSDARLLAVYATKSASLYQSVNDVEWLRDRMRIYKPTGRGEEWRISVYILILKTGPSRASV